MKMKRRIIEIDEAKCNGCGACAKACHEGAIAMVDGKAKLMRDDYCDGLGDCLPNCPTGAITFVEREAAEYDQAAVLKSKAEKGLLGGAPAGGCPGSRLRTFQRPVGGCPGSRSQVLNRTAAPAAPAPSQTEVAPAQAASSQLSQWPVQIKLVPVNAPYFNGARLLIAADCTAFARADFHERFIKNHITLIGCPKLDAVNYADKLTEIIKNNDLKSLTVVRMEVPCCGGIENAVKTALQNSGKMIPWQVVTISTDGKILDD
jgi:Fe-S-cluster-containing hydrogenase component 2